MQVQLVELNYPQHGEEITLPRIVLITDDNEKQFKGIDLKEFIETGSTKSAYRSFNKSKIPHRGMITISWPELDKEKDFPYPREERLTSIANTLRKNHQKPA